jgi:hypothetical protein
MRMEDYNELMEACKREGIGSEPYYWYGSEEIWHKCAWWVWVWIGEVLGLAVWQTHCEEVLSLSKVHRPLQAIGSEWVRGNRAEIECEAG